jgi:hypothetical protein
VESQNLAKIYSAESKRLIGLRYGRVTKKRGPQNEGKFHYVIENTWRKNVSLWACQDVIENTIVIVFLPRY